MFLVLHYGSLLKGCSLFRWLLLVKIVLAANQFYDKISVQVRIPTQMDFSNSNGLFQFKWTLPIQMDFSNSNGLFQFKWTFPIQMDFSNSNGLFQLKWTFLVQMDFSNSIGIFQFKWTFPNNIYTF